MGDTARCACDAPSCLDTGNKGPITAARARGRLDRGPERGQLNCFDLAFLLGAGASLGPRCRTIQWSPCGDDIIVNLIIILMSTVQKIKNPLTYS